MGEEEEGSRGRVQGGRDVGISLITISIRGRAHSTGLGCPCTGGQKPQEEDDGKEERRSEQGEERRQWEEKRGNKEMR